LSTVLVERIIGQNSFEYCFGGTNHYSKNVAIIIRSNEMKNKNF